MPIDGDTINVFHIFGKEFGNILIGRPVHRHAQIIPVFRLESLFQVITVKPVLAEPVKVCKLLIGQLIKITIGPGGELRAHEIGQVKARVGHILALAGHEVGQVIGQLQP